MKASVLLIARERWNKLERGIDEIVRMTDFVGIYTSDNRIQLIKNRLTPDIDITVSIDLFNIMVEHYEQRAKPISDSN